MQTTQTTETPNTFPACFKVYDLRENWDASYRTIGDLVDNGALVDEIMLEPWNFDVQFRPAGVYGTADLYQWKGIGWADFRRRVKGVRERRSRAN